MDLQGLQRSIDGGQTWTPVDEGGLDRLYLLAIDPQNPDLIYGGVPDRGIFTYEAPN